MVFRFVFQILFSRLIYKKGSIRTSMLLMYLILLCALFYFLQSLNVFQCMIILACTRSILSLKSELNNWLGPYLCDTVSQLVFCGASRVLSGHCFLCGTVGMCSLLSHDLDARLLHNNHLFFSYTILMTKCTSILIFKCSFSSECF
jgi:hypothetical protein